MKLKTILSAAAAIAISSVVALAGNMTFFTSIGDQVFPFTAPENPNVGSNPGTIDNMTIGASTPKAGTFTALVANTISGVVTNTSLTPLTQGAPSEQDTAVTLTAANLQAGIIESSPSGAINLTLPLGTAMDTAFPNAVANSSFDFSVISAAGSTNLPTIVANTGFTIVGAATFTAVAGNAGRFRARKTGTGTWVLYRIS